MKTVGSRAEVWHGTAKKTSGGLLKKDLKKNKRGRIVSKKMSNRAKKEKRLEKAGYKTKKGVFKKFKAKKKGGFVPLYVADKQEDLSYKIFRADPRGPLPPAYNMLINSRNPNRRVLDLRDVSGGRHNIVLRKWNGWDRIVFLQNHNREDTFVSWSILSNDKNELEDFLESDMGANHINFINNHTV